MNFEQILDFIQAQNPLIIYLALLASAFIENIFPPYPGDAVTLAGVYVAGEGGIAYIGVLISVVIGGTLGAMFLYYLGKTKGRQFFETGMGRRLDGRGLHRVERLFSRYGSPIILISRFFPGIRSVVSVTAGVANVETVRMWVMATLSFIIWNAMLLALMIYSKSNWQMIVDLVKKYNIALLIVAAIIIIIWMVKKLWIRKNTK